MCPVTHNSANEEKVNEILLAAQKRFGVYGFGKTAMHEIADDLGISKALLYYYYPDKEELFKAVFRKEQHEYIDQLNSITALSNDLNTLLQRFLEVRMNNFRKFINLGRASLDDLKGIKMIIKDLWADFRQQEQERITQIFRIGLRGQQHLDMELDEIAGLYTDGIRGLSHIYIKSKEISLLDDQDYHIILKRVSTFTAIFIKGILNRE
ncbi:MAG TPA: TetR/AcrR family transcriptional regulator [Bacteroidales bacterium]|nr:TetR/AcrR family transcriptional regulator [Bacteroidales bacterium]